MWVDSPGRGRDNYVHEVDEEGFIPAGVIHSVRNIGGTTARWYYGYKRRAGQNEFTGPAANPRR